MNDFGKSRNLWRQEFALRSILWECRGALAIAFDERWKGAYSGPRDPEVFMATFERYLQHLNEADRDNVQSLLVDHLSALTSGKSHLSKLEGQILEVSESYKNSLASIPPSLDKAKGALAALVDIGDLDTDQELDAMCLLEEYVDAQGIAQMVTSWKEELRRHLELSTRPIPVVSFNGDSKDSQSSKEERKYSLPPPTNRIFWSSRDFMETLDAISRYRFMEVFNIGEFPEVVTDIEGLFATALMGTEPIMPIMESILGDTSWGKVVFDLWLASRSAMLCGRIRNFVEIALARIANHQLVEGWWPLPATRYERYMPDNYLTALSCVALLRLSRRDWQLERARQGVKWLAKQQQLTGAWTHFETHYEEANEDEESSEQELGIVAKLVRKSDLLTTLLAVEAIRLSGLDGYDHTVSMADSWIMSQQTNDGIWSDRGLPFPFMTVLVVEYFERKRPPLSQIGSYLGMARDFILRSRELVLEDNENSRRLAILVAFQGVEAFLYACLSHSSVNIKIFKKPDTTIGMRKALTQLQTHFQLTGVLNKAQVIEYRNELDRLAYHRDQIVHKGASIGEKEAQELVGASARFSDLICRRIFGHVLL